MRNRHRRAIEQASRRWRGGRHDDSARTRLKILISTQVMCGAGSAGVGVSTVIKDAMCAAGLSEEEARSRFYVLEKEGLLAKQGMSPALGGN